MRCERPAPRGRAPRSLWSRRHRRRGRHVARRRRARRDVRHVVRGHPADRARRDRRALAPVDRPLDRGRLARVPWRRTALHPIRQDRRHGRRPRRDPRRRHRRSTPAATPGPQSAPTSTRCSSGGGHARHHHRRPAPAPPDARSPIAGPRTAGRRSTPASRRAVRSCDAAVPPRCCGCTTRSRVTGTSGPATCTRCSCSTRVTPGSSTRVIAVVAEECAGVEVLDAGLLDTWLADRNDVSVLNA